ncbi:hypothetical protein HZB90_04320 [archaeon]|nr:hypothetical protein [archaeon]
MEAIKMRAAYVLAALTAMTLAGCGNKTDIPPISETQTSFTLEPGTECLVTYDPSNRPAKVDCLSGGAPYICLHTEGYGGLCRSLNRRKLDEKLGSEIGELVDAEMAVREGMTNAERSE